MEHVSTDVVTGETTVTQFSDEEVIVYTEQSWKFLRKIRNERLKSSDAMMLPDFPNDKAAWLKYRQELRDLPELTTDVLNIEWPSEPN